MFCSPTLIVSVEATLLGHLSRLGEVLRRLRALDRFSEHRPRFRKGMNDANKTGDGLFCRVLQPFMVLWLFALRLNWSLKFCVER